jgi:hypothetical protein
MKTGRPKPPIILSRQGHEYLNPMVCSRSLPNGFILIRKTLNIKPKDGTHWTIHSLPQKTTVSRPAVYRILKAFGLQHEGFLMSSLISIENHFESIKILKI